MKKVLMGYSPMIPTYYLAKSTYFPKIGMAAISNESLTHFVSWTSVKHPFQCFKNNNIINMWKRFASKLKWERIPLWTTWRIKGWAMTQRKCPYSRVMPL